MMKPVIAKSNSMPKRIAWLRHVVMAKSIGGGRSNF
jgi:hypothetical protein